MKRQLRIFRRFLKLENDNKIKKIGVKNLIMIGLCGIALIVLSIYQPDKKKGENVTKDKTDSSFSDSYSQEEYDEKYVTLMEDKLEKMLNEINGAKPVKVMITLKSSCQKIVLKDSQSSNESYSENVVSFDMDDDSVPFVVQIVQPQIEGILIITNENATSKIINDIYAGAMALFELDAHKIKVIKGK